MATVDASGNIKLWDFDYDKHNKKYYSLGRHSSMCQGLSWSKFNPDVLLSCGQEGVIYLWVHFVFSADFQDRRSKSRESEWRLSCGAKGLSYVKWDPFHNFYFSCIHDESTIKVLFDYYNCIMS